MRDGGRTAGGGRGGGRQDSEQTKRSGTNQWFFSLTNYDYKAFSVIFNQELSHLLCSTNSATPLVCKGRNE